MMTLPGAAFGSAVNKIGWADVPATRQSVAPQGAAPSQPKIGASYVPASTMTVSPGCTVGPAFWIVSHGDAIVPGFESLPVGDT